MKRQRQNASRSPASSGAPPHSPEPTSITGDGSVRVDLARRSRCGFPEVVYAPGKTPEVIVAVFRQLLAAGQPCLATRVSPEQAAVVQQQIPECEYHSAARTLRVTGPATQAASGTVIVVTAGTSDLPVAYEALETLEWMNCRARLITDVGVAGPQRLLAVVPELQEADALIVIAGMEGALPSVVAGHVSVPVFAVPTSVGYGASFGGIAALLSMLNSCAANVAVVNIDAGFKAAWLAGMVAQATARHRS